MLGRGPTRPQTPHPCTPRLLPHAKQRRRALCSSTAVLLFRPNRPPQAELAPQCPSSALAGRRGPRNTCRSSLLCPSRPPRAELHSPRRPSARVGRALLPAATSLAHSSAEARLATSSRTSHGPLLRSKLVAGHRPRAATTPPLELAATGRARPDACRSSTRADHDPPRALLLVALHLLATVARLPRRLHGAREILVAD